LIHSDDHHHEACAAALSAVREPLGTVWPAAAEAMYLLRDWRSQDVLWKMLDSDALVLLPLEKADLPRMRTLMGKYRDLPMDLADAALVRVAERERIRKVFTLDRKDFAVYRPQGIERFTLIP
jgi:predicted nucleic acid-binding protein